MRGLKLMWLGVGALLVVASGVFALQRAAAAQAREEVALLRSQREDEARLRDENSRLVVAQVPEAELERLKADRAALGRLRAEVDELRERANERSKPAAAPVSVAPVTPKLAQTLSDDEGMATGKCRNVGRATPAAAIETALWAGAGGDVEALAGLLYFDARSRQAAEQLLASVSGPLRAQCNTPEQLIAMLTAKDIPLGRARMIQVFDQKDGVASDHVTVALELSDPKGKSKNAGLLLRQTDDGWKLVVRDKVIEDYAAKLKGEPAAAESK